MDFRKVDMRIRISEVECQLDLFLVSKEAIKGEKIIAIFVNQGP